MSNETERIPLLIYGMRKFSTWIFVNSPMTEKEAEGAAYSCLALLIIALILIPFI
ncbi:hypothetical protein KAR91_80060 [Candidatus Pacearchaeota archaeon]|nr:hypothetical protein [Candidatus Pacearchaeota archaeon]